MSKPCYSLVFPAAVLWMLSASLAAAEAGRVDGLRVWASDTRTRAVLDVSGPVDYRVFSLHAPERLVVDIRHVRAGGRLSLPDSKGLLRRVRHAPRDADDLRVVFDLNHAANSKSFLLKPAGQYGDRLVIDLRPVSGQQPTLVKTAASYARNGNREVVVAIDAGHGGEDPGAIGARGTREKTVTLAIARRLARKVNRLDGFKAVLIRDGDYYVPLRERFSKARRNRADLFISIHADSFPQRSVRGSSVYILSKRGASSEAARWLAARHDKSDLIGGVNLADKDRVLRSVLLDLSQNAASEMSENAAKAMLNSLSAVGKNHKPKVERAPFAVLKSPDVPSILVETAFISNPAEEKKLKDPRQQSKLADAMAAGLVKHFYSYPPPGTLVAARETGRTHQVNRGDTLSGIAARYDISLVQLKSANRLTNDSLYPGTVLTIP